MKRLKALKIILEMLGKDDIAVFTTGMISREANSAKDRHANFYMIGSMGLASSVGLGIALNSKKKVFIFDGDGSALMDMGTMAQIASEAPKNLVHIVLDNQTYQSTGNQPTITKKIALDKIAKAAGYNVVKKISSLTELKKGFPAVAKLNGPAFILIKVSSAGEKEPPRISLTPEELKNRIMGSLKGK